MTHENYINEAMAAVTQITGVPEAAILHSNIRRHADARYVLVCALSRIMTDAEIGSYLNRTSQGIGFIRRSNRGSRMVEYNLKEVCKRLESVLFST